MDIHPSVSSHCNVVNNDPCDKFNTIASDITHCHRSTDETGRHREEEDDGSYAKPLEATNSLRGTSLPEVKDLVITLNDSKAGMQGLDLDKINKIITESSEGSKFYEHKRKMKQRLEQKAIEIRKQYEQLTPSVIEESMKKVDKIAAEVEAFRDRTKVIVHIDMDCFFAAVEMRDNPTLRDKPMAVGSNSMLSTSNYNARKFGVRAAMPGFIAKKLCPNLIIIPPDFSKYSAASEVAARVYREYDPRCYTCMDEASLDITEYLSNNVSEEDLELRIDKTVQEIRERVCAATNGLTCSAGISSVGFISKICSDLNKPNGQFRLKPDNEQGFLKTLKIRKVCGIGEATESLLGSLDIHTCGDIWTRRGAVNLLFKPATADFLFKVSLGIGKHFFSFPTPIIPGSSSNTDTSTTTVAEDRKSISSERTFSETGNLTFIYDLCLRLCHDLAEDLVSKNCTGKAVAVKIKTDTFDVKTRIRTLLDYTADPGVLCRTAWSIFETLRTDDLVLRLFGVRISSFNFKNTDTTTSTCTSTGSSKKQSLLFQQPLDPYECPICLNLFQTSFSLRKHIDDCLDKSEQSSSSSSSSHTTTNTTTCNNTEPERICNSAKREYPSEPPNDNGSSTTSTTNLSKKRFKASNNISGKGTGNSGSAKLKPKITPSSSSAPKKSQSPIKMMPINFYFQNRTQ